jgi:hypothetical protein
MESMFVGDGTEPSVLHGFRDEIVHLLCLFEGDNVMFHDFRDGIIHVLCLVGECNTQNCIKGLYSESLILCTSFAS